MAWLKRVLILLMLLILPQTVPANMNLSPSNQEQLLSLLKGLAKDHAYKQWCEDRCGQIHLFKLSGNIASGLLQVSIHGNIVGKDNGVLPLFGTVPAIEIQSLKNGLNDVPLVFLNKSFYTLLAPGPFHLTGQIKIDRSSSTNVTLPAPVGQVILDIPDQEPLLRTVRLGQVGGSFQIVARSKKGQQKNQKLDLRLDIKRSYNIGRDKTFEYKVHVVGAQVGQVISIPLQYNEKVLLVEPSSAKISADKVEFTATGSDNFFLIEGEWTKDRIELTAAAGAVNETWKASCEGAYDCQFKGDVEKAVGVAGHQWVPRPGQKLSITWKELGLAQGQSIVAEQVLLDSRFTGQGLKQELLVQLKSSSADQVYLDLPDKAIPTALYYDKTKSPILKNDKGLIHLTVPQGKNKVKIIWEIPKREGRSIPLPEFHLPTGKWVFWVTPNKKEKAIFAGGLPGSPVVLFWPRMGLCLFMGLLFWWGERKLLSKSQTNLALLLILSAGAALESPIIILAILGLFALIRFLGQVKEKRTVVGWLFEGGVLFLLLIAAGASYFEILHRAFFSNAPFATEDFCSGAILGKYLPYGSLCWESTLISAAKGPQAPYVWVVPTLLVRIVYFVWALLVGYFFFTESKRLWGALKHYFSLGRRKLLPTKAKPL